MVTAENLLTGFDPVLPELSHVLILGSMPSEASLGAAQYYAHPRNAFWPIMQRLLQIGDDASYAGRVNVLKQRGVALWDVVYQCHRVGSLDSAIEQSSIVLNDIMGLLQKQTLIRAVFCNGGAAAVLFQRHFTLSLRQLDRDIEVIRLPSTSPANARLSFQQKYEQWRILLEWLE